MIGVSVFRLTGAVYRGAGSVWGALLIWAAVGALSLVGSLVYADLSTRVPEAGGPYAFVRVAFGRFPSFLDGWITLGVGNPATEAAGCALFGELLATLLGSAGPAPALARACALACLLFLTGLNWVGVRTGAGTQRLLTTFKLLALATLIGLCLWPFTPAPAAAIWSMERLTLVSAVTAVWYAYLGWQDPAFLAEELHEPTRDLPVVLFGSAAAVTAVYLSVNAAVFWAAHGTALAAAELPATLIAQRVLGGSADRIMTLVILVSMLGGNAEGFFVHPRLGYAMARDGLAPRQLTWVNRGGTPAAALLFHSLLVLLLLLANRFEQILAILAFAQALQAVLEAASYFVVRRKLPGKQFTPLHPVLPAAFVGANAALALWVAIEDPLRAAWGAGVIALASAGFLIAGRGRWYGAKARALESGR